MSTWSADTSVKTEVSALEEFDQTLDDLVKDTATFQSTIQTVTEHFQNSLKDDTPSHLCLKMEIIDRIYQYVCTIKTENCIQLQPRDTVDQSFRVLSTIRWRRDILKQPLTTQDLENVYTVVSDNVLYVTSYLGAARFIRHIDLKKITETPKESSYTSILKRLEL